MPRAGGQPMTETEKAAIKEALARADAIVATYKIVAAAVRRRHLVDNLARELEAFAAGARMQEVDRTIVDLAALVTDRDALRERNRALVAALRAIADGEGGVRLIARAALAADAKAGEGADDQPRPAG